MSRREQTLQQVQQIIWTHLQGFSVRVFLYGSWAKGQERLTSDIDIGIFPEQLLPPGTLSRLRSAMEEASLLYPVEVVDLTKADDEFMQKVLQEGTEWKDLSNEQQ